MEISTLPEKEFKETVIRILNRLESRMELSTSKRDRKCNKEPIRDKEYKN